MCPQRAVLPFDTPLRDYTPSQVTQSYLLGHVCWVWGLFSHNLYKGTVLMSSNREKVKIRRVTGGAVKKEILIGSRQNTMTSVQILNKYVGSLQRLLSSKELMCMWYVISVTWPICAALKVSLLLFVTPPKSPDFNLGSDYPICHGTRGGVHPWQVAGLLQG